MSTKSGTSPITAPLTSLTAVQTNTLDSSTDHRRFSTETLRPRGHRTHTMTSGVTSFEAFMSPSATSFPSFHDFSFMTAGCDSTAPPSPTEMPNLFFDGISDDSDFYAPTSGSEASFASESHRSASYSPSSTKSVKECTNPKIARPPNAWILYRSTKLAEYKNKNPDLYTGASRLKIDRGCRPTQASMSKHIAAMWSQEPREVKEHFYNESLMRSVMHAVENPGYRFNPNKGRKKNKERKRAATKVPQAHASPSSSPAPPQLSPMLSIPSIPPLALNIPLSSALPIDQSANISLSPTFQYAMTPPQTGYASSFVSVSEPPRSAGESMTGRRPSIQAQWARIFGEEADSRPYYGSSASSSAVSSPPWTGGLLPALSIDDTDSKPLQDSGRTTPVTPVEHIEPSSMTLSDSGFLSSSFDSIGHFDFAEPSSAAAFATESHNDSKLNSLQLSASVPQHRYHHSALGEPQEIEPVATYLEWWPYRHVKVRPDSENGIPLLDLLESLNSTR